MSRRLSREIALKTLFMLDFTPDAPLQEAIVTAQEGLSSGTTQDEYASILIQGTLNNRLAIDTELTKLANGWTVERMATIDRNVLRLSVYEILYGEEKVAPAIAVNEAVELAKIYGTDESSKFVKGILGKLVKNHAS